MPYSLRIFILLVLAAITAFGSLSYRTGGVAPGDFTGTAPIKVNKHWQTSHPDTLMGLSEQAQLEKEYIHAEELSLQAFKKDITSGKAAAQLLRIYLSTEKYKDAEKIAERADNLWPSYPHVRSSLAAYWLAKGDLVKLISEWSSLLITSPNTKGKLFPALQQLINSDENFYLFEPYIRIPPKWWDSFYGFLAKDNKNSAVVDKIYLARMQTGNQLSKTEINLYIKKLIRDRRWSEAYSVWLKQLDEQLTEEDTLLYDGGFEKTLLNSDSIFGWKFKHDKKFRIRLNSTAGTQGQQALQLFFGKKQRIKFNHIEQTIFLEAGSYKLSLRYRLNNLKTPKGLSWRVYCLADNKLLAESSPMAGNQPWKKLNVDVKIPDKCPAQRLRLEATSPHIHDHLFQGAIWFDELNITKVD